MKWSSTLVALLLLPACKPASAPSAPGVSHLLRYPVLLIGQNSLDVRKSEDELISSYGYSGMNFLERLILDSDGRLFEVTRAAPEPARKPAFLDMGTSKRRYALELREKPRRGWPELKNLLLDQVKAPNSVWAGHPRAVAKVESFESVSQAMEACRTTWEWTR